MVHHPPYTYTPSPFPVHMDFRACALVIGVSEPEGAAAAVGRSSQLQLKGSYIRFL